MTDSKGPAGRDPHRREEGILREPTLGVVAELRRHWTVALSTEPLSREAVEQVAQRAVRRVSRSSRSRDMRTCPSHDPIG